MAESARWSCLTRLDEDEPFRAGATRTGARAVLDRSDPGTEARLTLRGPAPTDSSCGASPCPTGAHLVAGLTVFGDAVGADVHYDLRDLDGTTRRVLVPYRFQPGLALRLAVASR